MLEESTGPFGPGLTSHILQMAKCHHSFSNCIQDQRQITYVQAVQLKALLRLLCRMTSRPYRALEENNRMSIVSVHRLRLVSTWPEATMGGCMPPKPRMLRRKKTQVCLVSSLSTLLFLEASPVPNVKNQESQGKVRWKSHPRDIRWARMGGTIRISKMSLRWRNLGCCRGRVTRLTVQVYGPGANHCGVRESGGHLELG